MRLFATCGATPLIFNQQGNAHQEEVIGEATKRLSPEFRAKYSEVPWRRIAGLRDVLIHDYLRVDLEEVWGIIVNDLPSLKTAIDKIIQDLPK